MNLINRQSIKNLNEKNKTSFILFWKTLAILQSVYILYWFADIGEIPDHNFHDNNENELQINQAAAVTLQDNIKEINAQLIKNNQTIQQAFDNLNTELFQNNIENLEVQLTKSNQAIQNVINNIDNNSFQADIQKLKAHLVENNTVLKTLLTDITNSLSTNEMQKEFQNVKATVAKNNEILQKAFIELQKDIEFNSVQDEIQKIKNQLNPNVINNSNTINDSIKINSNSSWTPTTISICVCATFVTVFLVSGVLYLEISSLEKLIESSFINTNKSLSTGFQSVNTDLTTSTTRVFEMTSTQNEGIAKAFNSLSEKMDSIIKILRMPNTPQNAAQCNSKDFGDFGSFSGS